MKFTLNFALSFFGFVVLLRDHLSHLVKFLLGILNLCLQFLFSCMQFAQGPLMRLLCSLQFCTIKAFLKGVNL